MSPHAPVAAPDTVQDGDLYIPGGFVERIGAPLESIAPQDSYDVPIKSAQLHYFREILKMAKASGAKVMVVVQPMRAATVRHFLNRALISQQLSAIAHSEGAAFLDFNQLFDIEGPTYFYDADHLTQLGVEVFDRQLLRELGAPGASPARNQSGARRSVARRQDRIPHAAGGRPYSRIDPSTSCRWRSVAGARQISLPSTELAAASR